MSSVQQRYGLPRFLVPLARLSRISLDSLTDNPFVWPKDSNFLSLITANIGSFAIEDSLS